MADIKRPSYFNEQFLVEKDFNDEQAYHRSMRHRHNRVLHTSGVVEGLAVTRDGPRSVQVSAGTAIDKDGREVVVESARAYALTTVGSNLDVHLTIAYDEFKDPADRPPQGDPDDFTRTTERPKLQDGAAAPPADSPAIVLALIRLNGNGEIEAAGSINTTVRSLASSKVAPQSIGTTQLANGSVLEGKLGPGAVIEAKLGPGAVTETKLGPGAVIETKLADGAVTLAKLAGPVKPFSIDGVSNPGGNIDLVAGGGITIVPDNSTAKKITISALVSLDGVSNPGGDIDLVGSGGITIAPDNTGKKITISQAGALKSLDGVSNDGSDIDLVAGGSITITPDNTAKRITIGESHSTAKNNPHEVTAAQVGALPLASYGFANSTLANLVFTNADSTGQRTVSTTFRAQFLWVVGAYAAQLGRGRFGGSFSGFADLRGGLKQTGTTATLSGAEDDGLTQHDVETTNGGLCVVTFRAFDVGGTAESIVRVAVNSATQSSVTFGFERFIGSISRQVGSFKVTFHVLLLG